MFQGFTDETIAFLLSIRLNNTKTFFDANREMYERSVKQPLRALAEDLALSLRSGEYGAEPFVLAADIAAAPGKEGRAGWSWYTGAAGWYLRLLRELYGAEP